MPNEGTAVMTGAQQRSVSAHQPGQDIFKSVLSEDIHWKPFAAFPPSVRLAVIVGQPSEAGPYTIRVRVPIARLSGADFHKPTSGPLRRLSSNFRVARDPRGIWLPTLDAF
jgi:hypothetical protein